MQALVWDWVRARTKLGTAITASRAITKTTIMSSTIVKPALSDFAIVISVSFLPLECKSSLKWWSLKALHASAFLGGTNRNIAAPMPFSELRTAPTEVRRSCMER
jgi:hypothetical protein